MFSSAIYYFNILLIYIFMFNWVIYHYLFWTGSHFLPALNPISFRTVLPFQCWTFSRKQTNMYFITEQFYQLPIKGFLTDLLTSIFGRSTPNENNEKTRQKPRLLDLHLAEINQRQGMWFQRIFLCFDVQDFQAGRLFKFL